MKKLLLALTFIAAGTLAFAQESNPNAPEITFEEETIDYGTVEKGSDGTREFVFTITGKEPLIITRAVGSCGCTVPVWPKEPIAPGASDSIKINYNAGSQKGKQHKTVTLTTNTVKGKEVCSFTATLPNEAPAQGNVAKKLQGS